MLGWQALNFSRHDDRPVDFRGLRFNDESYLLQVLDDE